jgi:cell division protein FtsL
MTLRSSLKKKILIGISGIIQILFIMLYISDKSYAIKRSYELQKKERCKQELIQDIKTLKQQIHTCTSKEHIENYAREKLALKPIRLHRINKL